MSSFYAQGCEAALDKLGFWSGLGSAVRQRIIGGGIGAGIGAATGGEGNRLLGAAVGGGLGAAGGRALGRSMQKKLHGQVTNTLKSELGNLRQLGLAPQDYRAMSRGYGSGARQMRQGIDSAAFPLKVPL